MSGILWVAALLVAVIIILLLVWYCGSNKQPPKTTPPPTPKNITQTQTLVTIDNITSQPPPPPTTAAIKEETRRARSFPYEGLREAAGYFKLSRSIGRGKFGFVYKAKNSGYSKKQGDEFVAVRRIDVEIPDETRKEILEEIDNASNFSHCNLIQLIGYSHSSHKTVMLIVMEYVSNGALHKHLFPTEPTTSASVSATRVLSWANRYKIARGLAAAVDYLHNGTSKCVIHGEIKLENVMLDKDLIPKLGDFGLSKLADHVRTVNTTFHDNIVPELTRGEKASKKSDVYALGIILLQIGTGRKQPMVEEANLPLVLWVWNLHSAGKRDILAAADWRLRGAFVKEEARRLLVAGLLCCHSVASQRPNMIQVKALLDGHISLENMPVKGIQVTASSD